MRTLTTLTLLTSIAFLPGTVGATVITPTIKASIHDEPLDGIGDSFNAAPFEGLLRHQSTREDRAIQEFDASMFAGAVLQSATLSGTVTVNNAFDNGVRTFDFLLYSGNGVADLSDFQIPATVIGSGSYHPPITTMFTYSFDVTAAAQTLLNGGATWIGLKCVCTSDPNFPNLLDDATSQLDITASPVLGLSFCRGDGSGTACPCGNNAPTSTNSGCLSSLGIGATLAGSGTPSLSSDTVVLTGTNMPNSSALYFQGTSQSGGGPGVVFGDGLRCAGGTVVRLGTVTNAGGTSQYPSGAFPPVSVKGGVTAPGTRDYQVWYRNAAAFCTPSTFNLSNGLELTWTP
jgi:hypothetical protein